ncbi:MAG: transporter substrate-binding domain-containing protein [Clostridiales bacterium]|nr:transporter substrate-binding domain-containing protein [Clostridiales bacterium]
MKRFLAIMMAMVLVLGSAFLFAACDDKNKGGEEEKREVLVCGVTNFDPMNFKDSEGNWTGFDTEFAQLVGEKLDMDVEFQEIEWSAKYMELEAGSIDCIWNGFTANVSDDDDQPRSSKVDFSYGYMLNQQCVVVRSEELENYKTSEDLAGKKAVAEKGSAGESAARELIGEDANILGVAAQINTFTEVKTGASDFAVIDILLAQNLVGKGDYSDLAIADEITLESEIYAIGFKIGSPLTEKVNEAILALESEGKLLEIAEKYNLENTLKVSTDPIA